MKSTSKVTVNRTSEGKFIIEGKSGLCVHLPYRKDPLNMAAVKYYMIKNDCLEFVTSGKSFFIRGLVNAEHTAGVIANAINVGKDNLTLKSKFLISKEAGADVKFPENAFEHLTEEDMAGIKLTFGLTKVKVNQILKGKDYPTNTFFRAACIEMLPAPKGFIPRVYWTHQLKSIA